MVTDYDDGKPQTPTNGEQIDDESKKSPTTAGERTPLNGEHNSPEKVYPVRDLSELTTVNEDGASQLSPIGSKTQLNSRTRKALEHTLRIGDRVAVLGTLCKREEDGCLYLDALDPDTGGLISNKYPNLLAQRMRVTLPESGPGPGEIKVTYMNYERHGRSRIWSK